MNTLQNLDQNIKNEESWNEYLAGLIDGDGCFLISKAGYGSLEITMDIYDEAALTRLQKKIGRISKTSKWFASVSLSINS
jgi:hypothetical protein